MNRSIHLLSVLLWLASLPGLAFAQQPGGMDPAEMMKHFNDPAAMQRMAEQAQAAQTCMKDVDQKKLDALQKRAEAASREIDRLCKAGKRDEALAKALELGQEMQSDATVKKMRECTKGMMEMFKNMPWSQVLGIEDEPGEDDVCS
jgi:hypothetical protein